MKHTHSSRVLGMVLATGFAIAGTSFADDKTINNPEMSPIVREEFRRAREELKAQLAEGKKRIADLDALRLKVIAEYKKLGAKEKAWIEHFKKYDLLVMSRYVNETGEFVPAKEVSAHDTDNLNKLSDEYLQMRPFYGRLTAVETRKKIEKNQEKLGELVSIHSDPTDGNTPELAIITKEKSDATRDVTKVQFLAKQLGFDLAKDIQYADIPVKKDRAPASAKQ